VKNQVKFVPICSFRGTNLTDVAEEVDGSADSRRQREELEKYLPWWRGRESLVEALNELQVPARSVEQPLRFCALNSYRIPGIGYVITGIVLAGSIQNSTLIKLAPVPYSPYNHSGITSVGTVEMATTSVREAVAGDHVGLWVRELTFSNPPRGYIAGEAYNHQPLFAFRIVTKLIVLDSPLQKGKKIGPGYQPILYSHCADVPASG
jgi:elongation factor 1-alpha